jgi:2'-5' RNA ligase
VRSFLAIDLPDPLRARLGELQRELQRAGIRARYTRPEGIHLTLKFLGEIDPDQVPRLGEGLQPLAARCPPLDLQAIGLGAFPNLRRPRVLWIGVRGPAPLERLQAEIDAALADQGFAKEDRPFHPHLTLAREPDPRAAQALQRWTRAGELELGRFTAAALTLFESQLQPGGARYAPLSTFAFSAAASVEPDGSP